MSGKEKITVPEAARRLGVCDSAVRQAIYAGRLSAAKEGGTWYVDPASVAAYRVSNRGPSGNRPRAVLHTVNVDGLTSEDIGKLDEFAAELRAAKGAQAA